MRTTAIVLAFLASGICWAQPPADCKPSSLNVSGAPYPCVFPDHRAIFRVSAPDAQKVRVRVGTGFDMSKQADGLWYATTTPLVEGFHYYMISIDGASVSDPATQTFFGGGEWSSATEIPAADADFYSHKDVPHGLVRDQWYFSVTQQWRRSPGTGARRVRPGYGQNRDRGFQSSLAGGCRRCCAERRPLQNRVTANNVNASRSLHAAAANHLRSTAQRILTQ